jgi:hypothetical protein
MKKREENGRKIIMTRTLACAFSIFIEKAQQNFIYWSYSKQLNV